MNNERALFECDECSLVYSSEHHTDEPDECGLCENTSFTPIQDQAIEAKFDEIEFSVKRDRNSRF